MLKIIFEIFTKRNCEYYRPIFSFIRLRFRMKIVRSRSLHIVRGGSKDPPHEGLTTTVVIPQFTRQHCVLILYWLFMYIGKPTLRCAASPLQVSGPIVSQSLCISLISHGLTAVRYM